jgi:hypothetical protein
VGVIPAAGLGYILNGDGTSCYGQDVGLDVALQSDAPGSEGLDANRFPAVGLPAFGTVAGRTTFLAPTAGLLRALDLAANEYQGGADGLAAWNTETGQYLPKFPAQVNDLSFLTGPSVADVDGLPGEEIVAGTASMDLQAFNAAGEPATDRWPRLHGDWMVATPLVGSFGQRETDDDARQVVVSLTRRGTVFAYKTPAPTCSPASSPRFHHDNHNSGDFERDAVAPGKPENVRIEAGVLRFIAPGDDLLCRTADRYQLVHSNSPITGRNIDAAEPLSGAPEPAEAGTEQSATLPPGGVKRYVALRALDEQDNPGRTVSLDRSPGTAGPPGSGGPGSGSPGARRPCIPRRVRVTTSRIGPARLGRSFRALARRYRAVRRGRRATRFCVRGGGRFLVTARRGRISLVASTARGHRTRGAAPASRKRRGRPAGARRVRRGLLVGRRGRGRVVYGVRRGRFRYLAVVPSGDARRPGILARRLRALGLR